MSQAVFFTIPSYFSHLLIFFEGVKPKAMGDPELPLSPAQFRRGCHSGKWEPSPAWDVRPSSDLLPSAWAPDH